MTDLPVRPVTPGTDQKLTPQEQRDIGEETIGHYRKILDQDPQLLFRVYSECLVATKTPGVDSNITPEEADALLQRESLTIATKIVKEGLYQHPKVKQMLEEGDQFIAPVTAPQLCIEASKVLQPKLDEFRRKDGKSPRKP